MCVYLFQMQKHPFHLLFFFGGFADVGGIESFASDLLHAIRERFTRISLLCYAKPNNPLIEQLRTVEISIRNSTWRWGCKWSIPELVLIVLGLPTLHCADLIVFGKPFSPWVLRILNAAAGLGRKKRAPFLLVIPYKPCDLWRDSRRAQALQYYDKILVQAKTFEQDLRDLGYTGEVNILPYVPPHSPHRVTPLPISDPLRLGFLGRLEAQKNLPFLLEVFRAVLSHVSVDLHLFGTGSEQARLIRQVESCQLTGRVFFHGHVPREEGTFEG